jgi:hypothetical protein
VIARGILLASATALLLGATASAGVAGSLHHYVFFDSPSRNIGCVIIDGTARCDIVARSWSLPPRPKSCPKIVDFGQGLIVSVSGAARLVCAGDTARDPHAPILAYGQADASGSLRCTSAITGMTCRSARSGHGFFLARQRYTLF